MRIFSEQEKAQMRQDLLKTSEKPYNPNYNFNIIELGMALQIIRKVLGEEWYVRAGKEMNEKIDMMNFLKIKQSPISHYLLQGDPTKYIRLMSFANFLKNLVGKTNIQSKLKEYAREIKRKGNSISVEKFDSTYFELKIASYFISSGFRVEFIKELNDKPTPDLKIGSRNGIIVVECKKKRTKNNYSISNITDTISEANNQLESLGLVGIIAIELSSNKPLSEDEVEGIKHGIISMIRNMTMVSLVWILNEYVFLDEATNEQVIRTESHYVTNTISHNPLLIQIINVIEHPISLPRSLYYD